MHLVHLEGTVLLPHGTRHGVREGVGFEFEADGLFLRMDGLRHGADDRVVVILGAKSIRRDELRRNVVGPNRNGGVFQALEAHVELVNRGLAVRQHRSGGFGLFAHRERRVVVHVHAHARVEFVDRELRLLFRRSGEDFNVGVGVRLERRHEGVVGDGPVRVIGEEQVRAVLERFVAPVHFVP